MAETFLVPVIEKLAELLADKANSLSGVHREVKSLKDELEILEPFLRDAEAKSDRGEVNAAVKAWLKQLREVSDRIEDVVDEYVYHVEQHRHEGGLIGSLRRACHFVKALNTRGKIASEIQGIEESLRKIKERGRSYGLRPFEQGGSSGKAKEVSDTVDPRIGSLFVDDDELVAIESLSEELMRCLVEGPSTRAMVSIVGEGGIGKTTLANKIYKDVVREGLFDCHVWITVSRSHSVETVLKLLKNRICPATEQPGAGEIVTVENLISLLRNALQTKRFAVFFDDVWQTDFWGVIKYALPDNVNGSRIVLTTRNALVVESFKETPNDIVQELKTWSKKQALELFCKKAFRYESDRCCPPELEKLSREIVSKCQGLPLAIAVVGGLLSKKEKNVLEWQRLLDNLSCEFEENNELSRISKVLLLGYQDLSYNLKLCFLYFGIFPEDYSILDGRLHRIWIAEGFVKSRRSEKTPEQIAKEYLDELMNRNLVSSELRFGFQKFYKVHDLIREVILRKIIDLCFCQILKQSKLFEGRSRRLSIHNTSKSVLKTVGDNRVRSILLFNIDELDNSFFIGLFENCKFLKVLDFSYTPLYNLPKEIQNLIHLKYLCLRGTRVKSLPKSIGKLRNLETLDINHTSVRELPIEINKLRNLRHLLAYAFDKDAEFNLGSDRGVRIHEGIGKLEELQTLTCVEKYSGKVGFVKELQNLRKLKCLSISKVTTDMGKALRDSIDNMNFLEELFLSSIHEDEVLDLNRISSPPRFLSYLKLSCWLQELPSWISQLQYLQGLSLCFSRLMDDPIKSLSGLPNLIFLRLDQAYNGEELHFEKGGFQKLKQLMLRKLEALKAVKIDRGALPLVEEITFGPSPLIKEMPCDIQHMRNLKSLEFTDMPNRFVTALQPDGGSDYWKIQHVSSVRFSYYAGRGYAYYSYKLGSSELLKHLQRVQEGCERIYETGQNIVRLSL